MNAIENMLTRRSFRKYKADPIPDEILEKILLAGTFAPSGMNKQAAIIVAVTNQEIRNRLSAMNAKIMGSDNDPFYGAPVILVVLANKEVRTAVYDGSLVMGNLMLAAHELGIASCWIHRAKEMFETEEGKAILRDLGLEGDYEGVGNCVLGYADCQAPEPRPRKERYVYYIR